jgi:catechol 2,3-dioxygenase-like lactoylglutathione lyase family enzyme
LALPETFPGSQLTDPNPTARMAAVEEVAERFLSEETSRSVPGQRPDDRARFHRLVRQCAANWLLHPHAVLRLTRAKSSITLSFEGPLGGKICSVFTLRAQSGDRGYRFIGPNPDRKKLNLPPKNVLALDRLRELYDAFLPEKEPAKEAISAILHGDRLPDLVPLVEETRRALDGGQETSPPMNPPSKSAPKKPAPGKPGPAGSVSNSNPAVRPPLSPTKNFSAGAAMKSTAASPAAGLKATAAPAAVPPAPPTQKHIPGPMISYIMLTCPDVKKSGEFFDKAFKLKPKRKTADGKFLEFDFGGFTVALQRDFNKDERKKYGYGPQEKHRGWGALFVMRVPDFDLCLKRCKAMKNVLVDNNEAARSFIVRDPAGYLIEVVPDPTTASGSIAPAGTP